MNLDRIIAVRNNKTVYRDGDRCLKVFNEGYSKADVLNEALNQARIEETGLNIPKVLEVTVIDGKWTIVSDYIKGKTLAQLMQENPEKKDEYLAIISLGYSLGDGFVRKVATSGNDQYAVMDAGERGGNAKGSRIGCSR